MSERWSFSLTLTSVIKFISRSLPPFTYKLNSSWLTSSCEKYFYTDFSAPGLSKGSMGASECKKTQKKLEHQSNMTVKTHRMQFNADLFLRTERHTLSKLELQLYFMPSKFLPPIFGFLVKFLPFWNSGKDTWFGGKAAKNSMKHVTDNSTSSFDLSLGDVGNWLEMSPHCFTNMLLFSSLHFCHC